MLLPISAQPQGISLGTAVNPGPAIAISSSVDRDGRGLLALWTSSCLFLLSSSSEGTQLLGSCALPASLPQSGVIVWGQVPNEEDDEGSLALVSDLEVIFLSYRPDSSNAVALTPAAGAQKKRSGLLSWLVGGSADSDAAAAGAPSTLFEAIDRASRYSVSVAAVLGSASPLTSKFTCAASVNDGPSPQFLLVGRSDCVLSILSWKTFELCYEAELTSLSSSSSTSASTGAPTAPPGSAGTSIVDVSCADPNSVVVLLSSGAAISLAVSASSVASVSLPAISQSTVTAVPLSLGHSGTGLRLPTCSRIARVEPPVPFAAGHCPATFYLAAFGFSDGSIDILCAHCAVSPAKKASAPSAAPLAWSFSSSVRFDGQGVSAPVLDLVLSPLQRSPKQELQLAAAFADGTVRCVTLPGRRCTGSICPADSPSLIFERKAGGGIGQPLEAATFTRWALNEKDLAPEPPLEQDTKGLYSHLLRVGRRSVLAFTDTESLTLCFARVYSASASASALLSLLPLLRQDAVETKTEDPLQAVSRAALPSMMSLLSALTSPAGPDAHNDGDDDKTLGLGLARAVSSLEKRKESLEAMIRNPLRHFIRVDFARASSSTSSAVVAASHLFSLTPPSPQQHQLSSSGLIWSLAPTPQHYLPQNAPLRLSSASPDGASAIVVAGQRGAAIFYAGKAQAKLQSGQGLNQGSDGLWRVFSTPKQEAEVEAAAVGWLTDRVVLILHKSPLLSTDPPSSLPSAAPAFAVEGGSSAKRVTRYELQAYPRTHLDASMRLCCAPIVLPEGCAPIGIATAVTRVSGAGSNDSPSFVLWTIVAVQRPVWTSEEGGHQRTAVTLLYYRMKVRDASASRSNPAAARTPTVIDLSIDGSGDSLKPVDLFQAEARAGELGAKLFSSSSISAAGSQRTGGVTVLADGLGCCPSASSNADEAADSGFIPPSALPAYLKKDKLPQFQGLSSPSSSSASVSLRLPDLSSIEPILVSVVHVAAAAPSPFPPLNSSSAVLVGALDNEVRLGQGLAAADDAALWPALLPQTYLRFPRRRDTMAFKDVLVDAAAKRCIRLSVEDSGKSISPTTPTILSLQTWGLDATSFHSSALLFTRFASPAAEKRDGADSVSLPFVSHVYWPPARRIEQSSSLVSREEGGGQEDRDTSEGFAGSGLLVQTLGPADVDALVKRQRDTVHAQAQAYIHSRNTPAPSGSAAAPFATPHLQNRYENAHEGGSGLLLAEHEPGHAHRSFSGTPERRLVAASSDLLALRPFRQGRSCDAVPATTNLGVVGGANGGPLCVLLPNAYVPSPLANSGSAASAGASSGVAPSHLSAPQLLPSLHRVMQAAVVVAMLAKNRVAAKQLASAAVAGSNAAPFAMTGAAGGGRGGGRRQPESYRDPLGMAALRLLLFEALEIEDARPALRQAEAKLKALAALKGATDAFSPLSSSSSAASATPRKETSNGRASSTGSVSLPGTPVSSRSGAGGFAVAAAAARGSRTAMPAFRHSSRIDAEDEEAPASSPVCIQELKTPSKMLRSPALPPAPHTVEPSSLVISSSLGPSRSASGSDLHAQGEATALLPPPVQLLLPESSRSLPPPWKTPGAKTGTSTLHAAPSTAMAGTVVRRSRGSSTGSALAGPGGRLTARRDSAASTASSTLPLGHDDGLLAASSLASLATGEALFFREHDAATSRSLLTDKPRRAFPYDRSELEEEEGNEGSGLRVDLSSALSPAAMGLLRTLSEALEKYLQVKFRGTARDIFTVAAPAAAAGRSMPPPALSTVASSRGESRIDDKSGLVQPPSPHQALPPFEEAKQDEDVVCSRYFGLVLDCLRSADALLETVASVGRSVEESKLPLLFSAAGRPRVLLREALVRGSLESVEALASGLQTGLRRVRHTLASVRYLNTASSLMLLAQEHAWREASASTNRSPDTLTSPQKSTSSLASSSSSTASAPAPSVSPHDAIRIVNENLQDARALFTVVGLSEEIIGQLIGPPLTVERSALLYQALRDRKRKAKLAQMRQQSDGSGDASLAVAAGPAFDEVLREARDIEESHQLAVSKIEEAFAMNSWLFTDPSDPAAAQILEGLSSIVVQAASYVNRLRAAAADFCGHVNLFSPVSASSSSSVPSINTATPRTTTATTAAPVTSTAAAIPASSAAAASSVLPPRAPPTQQLPPPSPATSSSSSSLLGAVASLFGFGTPVAGVADKDKAASSLSSPRMQQSRPSEERLQAIRNDPIIRLMASMRVPLLLGITKTLKRRAFQGGFGLQVGELRQEDLQALLDGRGIASSPSNAPANETDEAVLHSGVRVLSSIDMSGKPPLSLPSDPLFLEEYGAVSSALSQVAMQQQGWLLAQLLDASTTIVGFTVSSSSGGNNGELLFSVDNVMSPGGPAVRVGDILARVASEPLTGKDLEQVSTCISAAPKKAQFVFYRIYHVSVLELLGIILLYGQD